MSKLIDNFLQGFICGFVITWFNTYYVEHFNYVLNKKEWHCIKFESDTCTQYWNGKTPLFYVNKKKDR